MDDTESSPQGTGNESGSGRGSHESEGAQLDLHGSGPWTLADHEVEPVVLEGRIENLFDGRTKSVHLVDEEHLTRLEIRQDGGEIARPLQYWA